MKKFLSIIMLSIFIALSINAQGKEQKYESIWEGKLKISSVTLRLVVKIFKDNENKLSAVLDSPDQGAKDIPVSKIELTKDSLKFESKLIGASYSGAIQNDNTTITGIFEQAGMKADMNFVKVDKVAEVKRPQTPTKPYPYNEEEVSFDNKDANITLAGTLTFPKGKGPFPAVVLATGSGPQDRDETIFSHKPFLIIADYLTRNGIAVLRYDDRGIAKSKGSFAGATSVEFASDAISAVEYLKSRAEISQNKIGIVGHSEGGLIAPMAASISSDVNFIVMLAGPGMVGKDLLLLQTESILKASGQSDEEVAKTLVESKKAYDIVVSPADSAEAFSKLKKLYDESFATLSEEEKKKPEHSETVFNTQAKTLLSPWFRFFLKYDPYAVLENTAIPVLALNGEKDLQVPPKENLSLIKKALTNAGNKNFKTIELPELNHLFQHSKTGAPSEYGQIEETFSADALKIIGDWIREVTK